MKKEKISIRIIYISIVILLPFIILELGSRIILTYKYSLSSLFTNKLLNEYQMQDSENPGNWVLVPGFNSTLNEAIESKKRSGHILGAKYLEEKRNQFNGNMPFFRVNQDGYRGPEIDSKHSKTRILTIGDSCTFGFLNSNPYPRILEQVLAENGLDIEVINAGVEGYTTRNVLFRIEQLKSLKPDIAIIYIGWNGLNTDYPIGYGKYLYFVRLYNTYKYLLPIIFNQKKDSSSMINRAIIADKHVNEVRQLDNYVPSFMNELEEIITELESVGSTVVLMTLAGLFDMEENPTEQALRKGYVPRFTNNAFVFAKMISQYNKALRELAKRRQLQIIELDSWSKTALQPRTAHFIDSVHFNGKTHQMIGKFIAKSLMSSVQTK